MHALHYVNELLVRVRLAFQTFANSPNKPKLSKTGLGYDLEFFYITFLYKTSANVYAHN